LKLSDRIRLDRQTFSRLDGKRKWLFIWDYYRVPIISFMLLLAVAVIVIIGVGRNKADLYVVMVNANREAGGSEAAEALKNRGVGLDGRTIDIETSYTLKFEDVTETDIQTIEVLAVRFGIGDLDVFVADEPVFESYAEKDAFVNLKLFISSEELQAVEEDLYSYANEDGAEIIGGMWLRKGSPLHEAGLYQGDVLIGVASNAQNLDNALELVRQFITAR